MKGNIKNDQSGPKKDSEKLATIKKSEKAGDSKISEAKKIVISQAIIDAKNQTPAAAASSTSNENLFSHFINPQKAFTPPTSAFSSAAFSKDPVLVGNPFKFCPQSFVFGQKTLVPGSLQNKQESLTTVKSIRDGLVVPPKLISPQTTTTVSMKENNILKDSLCKQQSSTIATPSIHNSLVDPDITNSVQTAAGTQVITTTFNDLLSKVQSSTPVKPLSKLQLSIPARASTQNNLSRTMVDTQQGKEKTIILNNSLSNLLSSSSEQPSMQNSLVSNTTNLSQSVSDVQPMEQNGTFDDFLQVQESLSTITPSIQINSCGNSMNSEQLVEENTKQVAVPLAQSSVQNGNSGNSSYVQRFSVPVPVQNCHSNIQKAYNMLKKLQYSLQYSISTQTQVSNTTLSVSKDNNILPSQNSSTKVIHKLVTENSLTKGVKRKAEETKKEAKDSANSGSSGNSGISGKQKKNKKKQKFVQPRIVKRRPYNSQNNFPEINSNALTCAIVEEQYPNMPPLTNVHLGIIRNVIKEKIDNIPLGVFVPKFMNAFLKDGVILVECADNNSKDWLKHAISNYSPQEGVYLKVIPPDAINEYYPASIFVHDEENAIDVLKRLQKQNSDVSIQNWQYQSMIVVKECTPGITINVGIPATSVAQLKEKNFKLFHAMDQVMVVMNVAIPF